MKMKPIFIAPIQGQKIGLITFQVCLHQFQKDLGLSIIIVHVEGRAGFVPDTLLSQTRRLGTIIMKLMPIIIESG